MEGLGVDVHSHSGSDIEHESGGSNSVLVAHGSHDYHHQQQQQQNSQVQLDLSSSPHSEVSSVNSSTPGHASSLSDLLSPPSAIDISTAATSSSEAQIAVVPTKEQILKDLSDFVCSIRSNLAWSAVQTKCDHVYCGACLTRAISFAAGGKAVCPMDRLELDATSLAPMKLSNPLAYKILGRVEVHCVKYASIGCEWVGDYSNADEHILKRCTFALEKCAYCDEQVQKRHMKAHTEHYCSLRPLPCKFCHHSFPLSQHAQHVRAECQLAKVTCRGGEEGCFVEEEGESGSERDSEAQLTPDSTEQEGCGAVMERRAFAHHRSFECNRTRVSCPLAPHGCTATLKRSEVDLHLSSQSAYHTTLLSVRFEEEQRRRLMVENQLEKLMYALQEFVFTSSSAPPGVNSNKAALLALGSALNSSKKTWLVEKEKFKHSQPLLLPASQMAHVPQTSSHLNAVLNTAPSFAASSSSSSVNPQSMHPHSHPPLTAVSSISSSSAAPSSADRNSSSSELPLVTEEELSLLLDSKPPPGSVFQDPAAFLASLVLTVGSTLDIRDSKGKWLESEIIQRRQEMIMVHYSGWDSKWDEWINVSLEPHRIARAGCYSSSSNSSNGRVLVNPYKLHELVAVFFFTPKPRAWAKGIVWKIDGMQVSVRYSIGSSIYQRWFHVLSDEIVPLPAQIRVQGATSSNAISSNAAAATTSSGSGAHGSTSNTAPHSAAPGVAIGTGISPQLFINGGP